MVDSEPVIEWSDGESSSIIDKRKKNLYKSLYEISEILEGSSPMIPLPSIYK